MKPRVSVIVTAREEGDAIAGCLDRLLEVITLPCEILVICDDPEDSTVEWVEKYSRDEPRVTLGLNTFGRGPAYAIRYGFALAAADVVVVTMADGSDDPAQIDQMTRLVERGAVVVAASRYSGGGQQIGGPLVKRLLSRAAGTSLALVARVGTYDATNSFKAYSRLFVETVGIHSTAGFEVGLELVAKAHRLRLPVAEVPTVWLDRRFGDSNFQLLAWLPRYLRWYRLCFGRRMTVAELGRRVGSTS